MRRSLLHHTRRPLSTSRVLSMIAMNPVASPTIVTSHRDRPTLASTRRESSVDSIGTAASWSSTSSTGTISALPSASQGEEVMLDGLQHSEIRLEARQVVPQRAAKYKSPAFAAQLLDLMRDQLRVSSWRSPLLESSGVHIHKVAGSLTNAVFFVSYPTESGSPPRTVLLRIYGPSSGALISRPHELHTLHMLSSVYGIGPRVFGTFGNGRIEEFFESSALTAEEMRDPQTSRWIARRMRELHRVDIEVVSGEEWSDHETISVKRNVRDWLAPASEALDLLDTGTVAGLDDPKHPWRNIREDIDLDLFYRQWDAYVVWLKNWEHAHTRSHRVFAHNDTQYGNLLRLAHPREGQPNHHAIIVVDFEYAAPNPAAYDVANHFQEWTADYHSDAPHHLHAERYPSLEQRRNFYLAYLSPAQPVSASASSIALKEAPMPTRSLTGDANGEAETGVSEEEVQRLEGEVQAWSPACLAQWTVWGLVQGREDVLAGGVGEFDYLNYSREKVGAFRNAIRALGIDDY